MTDLGLAAEGVRRIEWAEREMPVLRLIRERFERDRPLDGLRIGACLHVTTETANLMRTLKAGGAEVVLAASQPAVDQGRRRRGARRRVRDRARTPGAARTATRTTPTSTPSPTRTRRSRWTTAATSCRCSTASGPTQVKEVLAGTEETTTGVIRLKAMAADGALGFPVVAVNEAQTKHLFDNRYGTGQSTVDGILRATNMLIAGRKVVIAGYGWVGKGIAARMDGHGAHVAVVEVDPVRALEALMDGFAVMTHSEAARLGRAVRDRDRQPQRLPARALRGDARRRGDGQLRPLRRRAGPGRAARSWPRATSARSARTSRSSTWAARSCNLIAEGRLVNLGAAEGHPAAVMDMSFANQALSAEYVAQHHAELAPQVYVVPEAIDAEVARLKLAALGIELEPMTAEQAEYVASWQHGT